MGIYINDEELRVMRTISPAARCAYIWLRTRMDWRTGLVGRVTSISRYALGEDQDYEVPKGRGVQLIRIADTTDKIKDAAERLLDVLLRVGLIIKRKCAVLTFFCPLASLQESVRSNQTNHKRTTPLSTEHTTPYSYDESSNGAGFDGFEGGYLGERTTHENEQKQPNAPHIKGHGKTSTPQPSSTPVNEGGFDPDSDDAGAGVNRDRAAPSQAGSLGRPGNTPEDPHRDRPTASHVSPQGADFDGKGSDRDRAAPSHPAQWRRSDGPAQLSGLLNPHGQTGTPACSAENESTRTDCATDERVTTLHGVLMQRGVRVPAEEAVLSEWVAGGVTPLELDIAVDKALEARRKAGSMQPINVGYVGVIIKSERSAARRAAESARLALRNGRAKTEGDKDFEALARSVGMWPAPLGWDWPTLRAKVYEAVDAAQRGADRA